MGSIKKSLYWIFTMTMTLSRAILSCSLLAIYLTKAASMDSGYEGAPVVWGAPWCPGKHRHISLAHRPSGLQAFSRRPEKVLWRLSDNVNRNKRISAVFLGRNGRTLANVELRGTKRSSQSPALFVPNWQAVAINKENGTSYIYFARFGDKKATIYKFKEPRVSLRWHGRNKSIRSRDIERIRFKYPNHVHDFKAMAVDPLNGDILVFTNNHQRQESKVYKVPQGSGDSKSKTRVEYVTTFAHVLVTGADISPAGNILGVANGNNIDGWSWTKPDGFIAWADFLKTGPTPCRLYIYNSYINQDTTQLEALNVVTETGNIED